MIETWQTKWNNSDGYDTRDGCMFAEIEMLRKANKELITELQECCKRSGYEQDTASIEACIELYRSNK